MLVYEKKDGFILKISQDSIISYAQHSLSTLNMKYVFVNGEEKKHKYFLLPQIVHSKDLR